MYDLCYAMWSQNSTMFNHNPDPPTSTAFLLDFRFYPAFAYGALEVGCG